MLVIRKAKEWNFETKLKHEGEKKQANNQMKKNGFQARAGYEE